MRRQLNTCLCASAVLLGALTQPVYGQSPQILEPDATRYLALGDSIPAGYRAQSVTNAYPFLLYQNGIFDKVSHTLFVNMSVPGATSEIVRLHQVPQALIPFADGGFNPRYVTLTVGGNDLLAVLRYALVEPDQNLVFAFAQQVLTQYAVSLTMSLGALRGGLPDARIFVGNQYVIPELEQLVPFAGLIVNAFNATLLQTLAQFPSNIHLVDVHAAFLDRTGLLLIERPHASTVEVHLTTAGHRAMAQAFADVIARHR